MKDKNKRTLFFLFITIIALAYCIPIIVQGTENSRMVTMFIADEGLVVNKLSRMFNAATLYPGHIRYGDFYFYINYFAIWLIKTIFLLETVSDQIIVISARLVDVTFAILSVGGLCVLCQKVYDFSTGVLAGLLLLTTPNFLLWATNAKPDVPQIFFLIMSIYFCIRLLKKYSKKDMILSVIFTSLSFGTKYSGVFLFPLICVAAILPLIKPQKTNYAQIAKRIMLMSIIFTATFFITNPYALIKFRMYQSVIRYQSAYLKFGHIFMEGKNPLIWLKVLSDDQLLGKIGLALLLIFSAITIWRLIKKNSARSKEFNAELLIQGWIFLFLFYLMWRIYHRPHRFLLAIVPFAYIFIALVINRLFNNQYPIKIPVKIAQFAAIGLTICMLWPKFVLNYDYFNNSINKVENSQAIAAGKYIAQNFTPDSIITYDAYSYVPPVFKNAFRYLGQNEKIIEEKEPDLIIVNDEISQRYSDAKRASLSRDPTMFMSHHSFYAKVENGQFPPYKQLKDFGKVRIYQKVLSDLNLTQKETE